jgi:hypothetical protein
MTAEPYRAREPKRMLRYEHPQLSTQPSSNPPGVRRLPPTPVLVSFVNSDAPEGAQGFCEVVSFWADGSPKDYQVFLEIPGRGHGLVLHGTGGASWNPEPMPPAVVGAFEGLRPRRKQSDFIRPLFPEDRVGDLQPNDLPKAAATALQEYHRRRKSIFQEWVIEMLRRGEAKTAKAQRGLH